MDFEPFFERCKAKYPKEECWGSIKKNVEAIFEDGDFEKPLKVSKLFYVAGKVSKPQFFRMKNYIKELYGWLYEQGYVSEELLQYVESVTMEDIISEDEIRIYYFRDLDGALDFVAQIGSKFGLSSEDDLLAVKSIVILSWYGLDRSEIVGLKKSDLISDSNSVQVHDVLIPIGGRAFGILKRFADLDTYRGFPSGKRMMYGSSIYLMRDAKGQPINANNVAQAIKRFNLVSYEKQHRKLSLLALQNNGVFYKMMSSERQDSRGLTITVKNIVGCDRHAAFWYKVMYEKWRSVYYAEACV